MKTVQSQDIDIGADLAKGIGIILVVVGHVLRGLFSAGIIPPDGAWKILDDMIYLFHMPLFFFISGLFIVQSLAKHGYGSVLKKTATILLVPLVVWSYLQFSLQYAAGGSVNNPVSLEYVLLAPLPPKQQFWFLGVLFFVFFITITLLRAGISTKGRSIIVVVLFLGQIIFWEQISEFLGTNQLLFLALQTFIHLPYFILATVIGRETIAAFPIGWLIPVALFLLSVCLPIFIMPYSSIVHVLCAILCVLALYKACEGYVGAVEFGWGVRGLSFLGMNSMIIFLAHVIVAAGFRILLLKVGVDDPMTHLIGGVTVGVLGPLVLIPFSLWLSKVKPQLGILLPARMTRA